MLNFPKLKNISINNFGMGFESNNITQLNKKLCLWWKLIEKNCDLIIYNKINKYNKIFQSDYNKISIVSKNKIVSYPKMSKTNCAKNIINSLNNLYLKKLWHIVITNMRFLVDNLF